MARYGRVKIGIQENYIKFENVAARRDFAEAFEAYHNAHEHDGEIPSFQEIHTKDVNSYHTAGAPTWGDKYLTIDGYKANEIYEYHTHEGYGSGPRYKPPKCCVSPLIVLDTVNIGGDGPFVDSGTLERHPLSAVFGDMPDDDFQSLLESVGNGGFFDPLIRMHEGKVLDGWHRYRAALALNIVRKLRFTVWQDEDEGDPKAFVLARNIDRRHLSAAQRGQIALTFHNRFGHGGDRANPHNDGLKTQADLAKDAGVSVATIERASQVEKEGQAEAVISGEKTATEVLKEREAKKLRKQKKQSVKSMWDTRIQVATDYTGDADSDLNLHLTLPDLEKGFAKHNPTYADAFESAMKRTSETSFNIVLEKTLDSDVDLDTLQTECRALVTYAADIRNWERADWSQDTNWILPLIEAKQSEVDTPQITKEEAGEVLREKARQQWQKAYTKVRVAWMDYEELSKSVEWNDFVAVAIKQHDLPSLSADTFTHADERIKSDDIQLLNLESVSLGTLAAHLRNPSSWVSNLTEPDADVHCSEAHAEDSDTPEPDTELLRSQERAGGRRKRMWSYFASEIRVKQGKTIHEVSEEDFAKAAAAALGLDTIRVEKIGLEGMEYCFGADEFILGDIQSPPYSLSDCSLADAAMWASRFDLIAIALMNMVDWVKTLLESSENFDKPEPEPQQEPDPEQIQQKHQEHVQRLKELPDEIRKAIPAWQEELCIEGTITLKLVLNARCHLEYGRERGPDPFFKEEMEDVLQLMLSNNEAFGGKVCELLDTDNIEPYDPLQYLQKAHDLMWMAFEDEGIADEVSRDDFIKAACLAHPYWGVDVFPDLQGSDAPQIWEARFELLTSQIRLGTTWLKELIRANESETPVEPEPEETEVVDLKQQLAEIFGRNGFPNGVVGSIQIAWGTADKDYCAMFGQHPNPNARAISEIPEALLIALVELAATGKFHVYGNGVEPIIFERATRAKEDA